MNKQGREARTLQRIACNATNSAAINSETGQLYVWGSAKHGLLGKGEGT
jgi:alpha-tubulin suppressor-like RCC1 family protein